MRARGQLDERDALTNLLNQTHDQTARTLFVSVLAVACLWVVLVVFAVVLYYRHRFDVRQDRKPEGEKVTTTTVQHDRKVRPFTHGTVGRILYEATCSCGWVHPDLADTVEQARAMHDEHLAAR